MPISFRTFADLNLTVAQNLHLIDRNAYDAVVGIPRSGMIPASLISLHLQMPLADVRGFTRGLVYERSHRLASDVRRILLVDDSVNKGRAMKAAVETIRGAVPKVKITRLAVYGPYQLEKPDEAVDISFETVRGPRVFQWNVMKHIRLERWAFDFDGVLCRDPTKAENDDGPSYEEFLRTAPPMWLPTRPVGHIVTGRLEKYRALTEGWLKRHGVQYKSLTMMPYATKAERMAAGGRGGWKAARARELGVEMFIESDPKQAGIIAREAMMPVWCTLNQTFYPVTE